MQREPPTFALSEVSSLWEYLCRNFAAVARVVATAPAVSARLRRHLFCPRPETPTDHDPLQSEIAAAVARAWRPSLVSDAAEYALREALAAEPAFRPQMPERRFTRRDVAQLMSTAIGDSLHGDGLFLAVANLPQSLFLTDPPSPLPGPPAHPLAFAPWRLLRWMGSTRGSTIGPLALIAAVAIFAAGSAAGRVTLRGDLAAEHAALLARQAELLSEAAKMQAKIDRLGARLVEAEKGCRRVDSYSAHRRLMGEPFP